MRLLYKGAVLNLANLIDSKRFEVKTADASVSLDHGHSYLVEAAKADFRQSKKRTPVTDLKLYVKPEERKAYYVVNEKHNGSVSY